MWLGQHKIAGRNGGKQDMTNKSLRIPSLLDVLTSCPPNTWFLWLPGPLPGSPGCGLTPRVSSGPAHPSPGCWARRSSPQWGRWGSESALCSWGQSGPQGTLERNGAGLTPWFHDMAVLLHLKYDMVNLHWLWLDWLECSLSGDVNWQSFAVPLLYSWRRSQEKAVGAFNVNMV